jgi:predicted outer membrane repeat protein
MASSSSIWARKSALSLAVSVPLALAAANGLAATYDVDDTRDGDDPNLGDGICRDRNDSTGRCTLRAAIQNANFRSGFDIINLASGATYSLTLPAELIITDTVDVYGLGNGAVIDGRGPDGRQARTISVTAPLPKYAYFYNVAITNGRSNQGGAGVTIAAGSSFTGVYMQIRDNVSTGNAGGGVAIGGTPTTGGGEFGCWDCTISGNSTPTGGGGGVQYSGGGMAISELAGAWIYRTTFSGNTANRGGAIAGGGYIEMQNSTISGNTATSGGGAMKSMASDAQWSFSFTTITNNRANTAPTEVAWGGAIFHTAGSINLGRSIIAGNTDGRAHFDADFSPDCAVQNGVSVVSHRYNVWGNLGRVFDGTTRCQVVDAGGSNILDILGYVDGPPGNSQNHPVDPKLDPLVAPPFGGTAVHPLRTDSPAMDWARLSNPSGFWLYNCPDHDQNFRTRPSGPHCDTGSYEYQW